MDWVLAANRPSRVGAEKKSIIATTRVVLSLERESGAISGTGEVARAIYLGLDVAVTVHAYRVLVYGAIEVEAVVRAAITVAGLSARGPITVIVNTVQACRVGC
jgi:hypothetical protein